MNNLKQDMVCAFRSWKASNNILQSVAAASKQAFDAYAHFGDDGVICEFSEEKEEAYKIAAARYNSAQLDYQATKSAFERAAVRYCTAICESEVSHVAK